MGAVKARGDALGRELKDAVRLAFGTLSIMPVRPPTRVDSGVAGWAMALGPLVGAVLGLVALAGALLLLEVAGPMLVAVAVVVVLGLLTRLIHWDGLADTADGLGSGRPADTALEIMRRGDIGPFGVFAIVSVFGLQVASTAQLLSPDNGGRVGAVGAIVASAALGRAALLLGCRRGVPAARTMGLGSAVAGSVGPRQLSLGAGLAVVVVALATLADAGLDWLQGLAATLVALAWAIALTAYLRRRLGGMTGDTLGALVETTTTVALVGLAAFAAV
jgi:adenosylcobinamide-GDP ribazoletransferase